MSRYVLKVSLSLLSFSGSVHCRKVSERILFTVKVVSLCLYCTGKADKKDTPMTANVTYGIRGDMVAQ